VIKLRVYEPKDIKEAKDLIGKKVYYGDHITSLTIGLTTNASAKLIDVDENDKNNPYIVYPSTEIRWKYIAVEI
jgi:hypothetical protein